MRLPRISLSILPVLLLCGCGFAAPLSEDESRQVALEAEAAHNAMLDAARRVDAEAVAATLADGGRFYFDGTAMTNEEARAFARRVYAGLQSQEVVVADQGVTVLGPDAAVVSGNGRVVGTDTAGARGAGVEAVWTFVWTRQEDGTWRVVDSHQSTRPLTP